MKLGRCYSSLT